MKTSWKVPSALVLGVVCSGSVQAQCERHESAKLHPPDARAGAAATSCALDGQYAAVGSLRQDGGLGAVDVYRLEGEAWVHEQKLRPPEIVRYDGYAAQLDLDGDRLAVCAQNQDDRGAVYIYRRDAAGWTMEQRLVPGELSEGAFFGVSLDLDGDTLAVGAPRADHGDFGYARGTVFVYQLEAGQWTQRQVITAEDPEGGDLFGGTVALDGPLLVVGAHGDDHGLFEWDRGSVFVYRKEGASYRLEQRLQASDSRNEGGFGVRVGASEGRILVSSFPAQGPSAVYCFESVEGRWSESQRWAADEAWGVEAFGVSLALDGEVLVLGARTVAPSRAFAYVWRDGRWSFDAILSPSDAHAGQLFGASIALDRGRALIGATGDDEYGEDAGAAYVLRAGRHRLQASAPQLRAGDRFTLGGRDGAAQQCSVLFLTALDGVPVRMLLDAPRFSRAGEWSRDLMVPGLLGQDFTVCLGSWALDECGRVEASAPLALRILR